MFSSQIRCKKTGCIIIGRKVNEACETPTNFFADFLELLYFAYSRVKPSQLRECFFPHISQAGAAKTKDCIKQRATLKTQRT